MKGSREMKKSIFLTIMAVIFVVSPVLAKDFDQQWENFDSKDWLEKMSDFMVWSDLNSGPERYAGDSVLVTGIVQKVDREKNEMIASYAFSDPAYEDSLQTSSANLAYFKVRPLGIDPLPKAFVPGIVFDVYGRVRGEECFNYPASQRICVAVISATDFYNVPEE